MEVKSTMTTCPSGHPYDMAKYRSCPYCDRAAGKTGGFVPTEAPGAGSFGSNPGFAPTEAPDAFGGRANAGFTPTEAPSGPTGGYQALFGATEAPDMRSVGGNTDPFSVETMIGGERVGGGSVEPVVGWLVCVDGPVRGVDFRIHAGYNYIGREAGDIHIRGDQQISRQNHAMIAYDSSEQTYFVGPAAGRNLIKVNGKTVLNAVEIRSYDMISIGTTKLIFVALCGEKFKWDQAESGNV